jgi:hypothetical protein
VNRLEELGINIGLSIAGFMGSIMFIGKDNIRDFRTTLISMFGGVASANYLTPVVSDILGVDKINHQFSIAFILGFMGLRGVEKIINKIFNKNKIQ